MKKVLLGILGVSIAGLASAQLLVSESPQAKNVVLEEFTGVNCGYCPDGHRLANQLSDANPGKVVLVNIHTGGYAVPNGNQPDFRTGFGPSLTSQADVQGYPSGTINRLNYGERMALNRGEWAAKGSEVLIETSPVNVGLSTSWNDATRELSIHVELVYTSDASAATNKLNIAFSENGVVGPQVDYANGNHTDYVHNHVFRGFITGQWGELIETTTAGSKVTKDFTYTVPEEFVIENSEVAAYVAEGNANIYSGVVVSAMNGRTEVIGNLGNNKPNVVTTSTSEETNFGLTFENGYDTDSDFKVTLVSTMPGAWTASYTVDGSAAQTGEYTYTAVGASIANIAFDVNPNGNTGIGKFEFTIESVDNPEAAPQTKTMYVVSEVTTLLLNSSNADGAGGSSAADWASFYTDAFGANSMANTGVTSSSDYFVLKSNNALDGVTEIYYNVGWTFPGLYNKLVADFESYLDNGGNLFIAGQDIGWETFDTQNSPYSTAETRSFFTNYMHAGFSSDGGTSSTTIGGETGAFSGVPSSGIDNYYGANYYPDELTVASGAAAILKYNGNSALTAGVAFEGAYKVVFMGIGLEMVEDVAARNAIIDLTDQFFKGTVTVGVLEAEMNKVFTNAYPVPATDMVTVELNNITSNSAIELFDITGKAVYKGLISVGATQTQINVSNLAAGTYMYRVVSANNTSEMKQLQVVK